MSSQRDLWAELIAEMEARRQKGLLTYGKPVNAEESVDWLQHSIEELLDFAIYAKAAKEVMEGLQTRIIELEEKLVKVKEENSKLRELRWESI